MKLASPMAMPMVLQAAIQLDVPEITAKAGLTAQLSCLEIESRLALPNKNPAMIDRMLRLLASYSVVTRSLASESDFHRVTDWHLSHSTLVATKVEFHWSLALPDSRQGLHDSLSVSSLRSSPLGS